MAQVPPHRKVLCQAPACWWREGLKCAPADQLLVARPHVLLRRPGNTAVGIDQHLQSRLHKYPKRYRICCASTNIAQLCELHTFPPSPKKGDSASLSPDMPSSGKRLQLTRADSSHLCRTRVSVVFLFQHRRADHHGEPALRVDGPSL